MTDDEARDYLMQHWHLYLGEEMAAAYARSAKRMEPHLIEVAKRQRASRLSALLVEFFGEVFSPQTTKPAEAGSEGQGA